MEILSRLPSKSVSRFRCVSKRWASMFASPYFNELFQTRSSAKPRLLFAIAENGDYRGESNGVWSFFSTPQLENPYEKSLSTLVAAAEFHVKFSPDGLLINHDSDIKYFSIGYASGLIYIYGCRYQARPLICNPNTGRYAILPYRYTYRKAYSFFGFDPIDKQYKALSIRYPSGPGRDKILTFGDNGDLTWRKIKFPSPERPGIKSHGICINGVLYFLAERAEISFDYVIVCFDVRSETFTFIDVERFCRLINYKGKLAVIYWEDDVDIYEICYYGKDLDEYLEENLDADATNELRVWVLEDVEKQKWSKYAYTWTDDTFFRRHLSIAGATASGEIVFSMRKYTPKQPFYVFYFNPEKNTLQRVEIQGFGAQAFKETCSVCTFVNHVEDLDVNDLKQLKSVHPPLVQPEYYESSESE
ncbi:F-box associated domain type 3 [Arabidopsis thaliana x Arabidopsis arenosa]|uniref:F-box associated domain type 3 n=1 Tax=Arabidopsis thaliana x Arabidopsis arenosa TaxID=1240361 RepID=A0A8T1ZGI5_9BRAS|nr:F-box associated domain type 3 [Arabidopsis thaliana x Arabidopsis arenosa]